MALLKIARMGHPVLYRRAEEVPDPTAPEVHRLIADMIETMVDADGAGLAAPQVHVSRRILVFHAPDDRAEPDEDGEPPRDATAPRTVLINPELEILTDEMEQGVEGCLSLPGLVGIVPRYSRVRYSGLLPDGSRLEREASGFHARVFQHEYDHLDGILYPMRMPDLRQLSFTEEFRRRMAAREAADAAAEEEEEEAV